MASTGQWEVVGKVKKPTKTQASSLTKNQKKSFVDRMPTIETRDPVQEDSTIYDAFNIAERRHAALAARDSEKARSVQSHSHSQTGAKKKKPEQNGKADPNRKSQGQTLETVLAQISRAELESIVSQSQLRFPENQDVWLKDLASFINLKLEKVTDSDSIYKDKPKDFPQKHLSKDCQKTINAVLKKCSKQSLDHLFYHCVTTMITDANKGLSSAGYKVFLQMLAFYKPTIVLPKLPQYLELIKTNMNRPAQCLSILWAIGQCGVADLRSGLRVWLDLMLPCLGIRSVAAYVVEYLENLFVWHKSSQGAFGEVGLKEYFNLLDTIFTPTFNIQSDLRKRLQAVYPEVKNIAYGANPSTNLRNFFASYLRRAEPNCAAAIKQEVLLCLVLCLGTDKQSWSTWCQVYTKQLPQSGVLLQHLAENWELLSKSERNMLRQTLRSFAVTNEELIAQGHSNDDGFRICNTTTKELLQKMSQSHFPWGMLVFFVSTVFAAIIAYDLASSPNIKASRTVRFLEDYGIMMVLEQSWKRITTFVYLVMSWSEENFPRYYTWLRESAGPNIRRGWQATLELSVYLVDSARPHCVWAVSKTQQGLVWLYGQSPETWDQLSAWLWLSWDFLKDYTHWIWKHVLHWALALQHYLQYHVIPSVHTGNLSTHALQETALRGVQQMHNYTLSFFSWCNQLLFAAD